LLTHIDATRPPDAATPHFDLMPPHLFRFHYFRCRFAFADYDTALHAMASLRRAML